MSCRKESCFNSQRVSQIKAGRSGVPSPEAAALGTGHTQPSAQGGGREATAGPRAGGGPRDRPSPPTRPAQVRAAGPRAHVTVLCSGGAGARGCQPRCSRAKRWGLLATREGQVAVANTPARGALAGTWGLCGGLWGKSAKGRMRGQMGTSGFALTGKSPERNVFQGQKPPWSQGHEPGKDSVAREWGSLFGAEQRCRGAQKSRVWGGPDKCSEPVRRRAGGQAHLAPDAPARQSLPPSAPRRSPLGLYLLSHCDPLAGLRGWGDITSTCGPQYVLVTTVS